VKSLIYLKKCIITTGVDGAGRAKAGVIAERSGNRIPINIDIYRMVKVI
jgi:hypothetical protein